MRLLRLASIHLLRAPPTEMGQGPYVAQNGVEVATDDLEGVETCLLPGVGPEVAPPSRPRVVWPTEHTRVRVGVSALAECPPVDVIDGVAHIARSLLDPLEQAIGEYADVLGVTYQCRRLVRSPQPCVAIAPSAGDGELFRTIFHLQAEREDIGSALVMPPILPSDLTNTLVDRMDGAALLADSLGEDTPIGRVRDLFRLFERAFKKGPTACIHPLSTFLRSHPRHDALQYSGEEVAHWFDVLRATSMHADRRSTYARSIDVAPYLGRMEVAAYDVLLNKAEWRSPSSSRRAVFEIATGVGPEGKTVVLGAGAAVQIPWMDPWGGYPIEHGADVALPSEWVSHLGPKTR